MSKKLAQEYLKKGDKINTTVIFDNGKKFEIKVEGEIREMSDNGFSKKQLEQLQGLLTPIVQDIKEIKSRLDVIESLPTIQKELKSQNKK